MSFFSKQTPPDMITNFSLCGISEARADEIKKAFEHGEIDCEAYTDLVAYVKKAAHILTTEDYLFLGYLLGKKINAESIIRRMEKLLGKGGERKNE